MGVNIQVVVASESVQGIQTSRGEILLVIASAPLQSSWPAFDDLQGQPQVTDSSLLACRDIFYSTSMHDDQEHAQDYTWTTAETRKQKGKGKSDSTCICKRIRLKAFCLPDPSRTCRSFREATWARDSSSAGLQGSMLAAERVHLLARQVSWGEAGSSNCSRGSLKS